MSAALEGRTALVLGADGRLGNAIARSVGRAGSRLILAARNVPRLEELRGELESVGVEALVMPTDVTEDDAVQSLVERASGLGMDIAVNNAGATHMPAPLGDLPLGDADRVLRVTLRGTMVAMRSELPALPEGGAIVNVASTAGLAAAPGMAAYVAAKHGVIGLTRSAAIDYAGRGIRVNAVAPGSIDSGGITAQPEQVRERVGRSAPMRRLGTGDEVAAAVVWLVSREAAYVTGSVLVIDGGRGGGRRMRGPI